MSEPTNEIEVKLSDRTTATISALTALESMNADELVGASKSPATANKVYSICSIRKLNGEPVFPQKNKTEFLAVAGKLDLGELLKLGIEVSKITEGSFSEDLKNELAALASDS